MIQIIEHVDGGERIEGRSLGAQARVAERDRDKTRLHGQ